MALFKVVDIISADTIRVSGWQWSGHKGNLVKIVGLRNYSSNSDYDTFAKNQLHVLLKDKQVELKGVISVNGPVSEETINCSVFLNDIDIAKYFPELKAN